MWCGTTLPATARSHLLTKSHSPGRFRYDSSRIALMGYGGGSEGREGRNERRRQREGERLREGGSDEE